MFATENEYKGFNGSTPKNLLPAFVNNDDTLVQTTGSIAGGFVARVSVPRSKET